MLSPLARALPAMTALQATVALGTFALSVLAPQMGVSVAQLAALNTVLFSVGALSALLAGRLFARLGDWNVAACCAAAIAAGMVCLGIGGPAAPWLAVVLFGLAFGPETPASASVLSRITPPLRRPWVFSVRQTGNQIGAMAGSLLLPMLWVVQPQLPFAVVALVAVAMAGWCVWLSRDARLAPSRPAAPSVPSDGPSPTHTSAARSVGVGVERAAFRRIASSPSLRLLAATALTFTAVQMCLNTFLMSLAVRDWQLPVATAAGWVACLQAAGLAGRLFWGWLAQHSASSMRLLGGLGLLMAASGIALMAWPAVRTAWLMAPLVTLLGFSASGWNGVLVAEVSRIAGPRDAGALTGAVIMFGYAGLSLAPSAFAALSSGFTMAGAFMMLLAAAGAVGLALLLVPLNHANG
jgi:sugar phosphate permease